MTTKLKDLRSALGCFAVEPNYEPNQLLKLAEYIDTLAQEVEATNARLAAVEQQTNNNAKSLLMHLAHSPESADPKVVYCDTKTLKFENAVNIAKGCHDYGGGYRHKAEADVFHHGIQTVINALEAASTSGIVDPQVATLHRMGSTDKCPEISKPRPLRIVLTAEDFTANRGIVTFESVKLSDFTLTLEEQRTAELIVYRDPYGSYKTLKSRYG